MARMHATLLLRCLALQLASSFFWDLFSSSSTHSRRLDGVLCSICLLGRRAYLFSDPSFSYRRRRGKCLKLGSINMASFVICQWVHVLELVSYSSGPLVYFTAGSHGMLV